MGKWCLLSLLIRYSSNLFCKFFINIPNVRLHGVKPFQGKVTSADNRKMVSALEVKVFIRFSANLLSLYLSVRLRSRSCGLKNGKKCLVSKSNSFYPIVTKHVVQMWIPDCDCICGHHLQDQEHCGLKWKKNVPSL